MLLLIIVDCRLHKFVSLAVGLAFYLNLRSVSPPCPFLPSENSESSGGLHSQAPRQKRLDFKQSNISEKTQTSCESTSLKLGLAPFVNDCTF